jgi:hypothetical protein
MIDKTHSDLLAKANDLAKGKRPIKTKAPTKQTNKLRHQGTLPHERGKFFV